jgi:hypothetical protein
MRVLREMTITLEALSEKDLKFLRLCLYVEIIPH